MLGGHVVSFVPKSLTVRLLQAKATVLQIKDTLQRPNDYLLGTFTYADISAAVLLQGLRM